MYSEVLGIGKRRVFFTSLGNTVGGERGPK